MKKNKSSFQKSTTENISALSISQEVKKLQKKSSSKNILGPTPLIQVDFHQHNTYSSKETDINESTSGEDFRTFVNLKIERDIAELETKNTKSISDLKTYIVEKIGECKTSISESKDSFLHWTFGTIIFVILALIAFHFSSLAYLKSELKIFCEQKIRNTFQTLEQKKNIETKEIHSDKKVSN